MKRFSAYILLLCLIPLLWSCEEVIELDLNETSGILTIEGTVEPTQASVRLSRSVGFYEENVFAPVLGASVSIADNAGNTIPFLDPDADGTYAPESWIGVPGLTYTLTVTIEEETYTSVSNMPAEVVSLDSLEVQANPSGPFGGGEDPDPFFLLGYYAEPGETVNYYRFQVSRNGQPQSVLFLADDELNNGIRAGIPLFGVGFKSGDLATVSLLGIEKTVFTYFSALDAISGASPFGSGAPADPESNISGGALGYFSAQTRHTATFRIP